MTLATLAFCPSEECSYKRLTVVGDRDHFRFVRWLDESNSQVRAVKESTFDRATISGR